MYLLFIHVIVVDILVYCASKKNPKQKFDLFFENCKNQSERLLQTRIRCSRSLLAVDLQLIYNDYAAITCTHCILRGLN